MNFYNTLLEHYYLIESLETTIKANPHIPENIIRHYHSTALPDNNKQDRLLSHVLRHHLATIDHLKAGLIDNDPYVRGEAQRIIIKTNAF